MNNSFYKGVILIVVSTIGFGIMPIFGKFADKSGITVFTLLFLRFLIAAVFFFSYILIKHGKIRLTPIKLASLFILGGICYTLQSTLYFSALIFISASLTALLLYTYPIIVTILSYFIDKEKLTPAMLVSTGLSFLGIILILGTSIGVIDFRGVLLAVGAAFVYSCYIIYGNRVVKQIQPIVTSAYVSLFASICLLAAGLFTNKINNILGFGLQQWLIILGLALFSTILAILTFFLGLELLGPTKASILSMLEPLFTVAFSAMFLNEGLTLYQMIGGIAVLSGAVLVVLSKAKDTTNLTVDGN